MQAYEPAKGVVFLRLLLILPIWLSEAPCATCPYVWTGLVPVMVSLMAAGFTLTNYLVLFALALPCSSILKFRELAVHTPLPDI